MRISGFSEFNLRSIIVNDKSTLVDFLSNNSQVKGKVIDVNSNEIKLLLENGKEFIANTNIPMDNLIGQEVNFKVSKENNSIILQPKIEGTALEKVLNMKINNIINELGLQVNNENKELIKEMIRQNIPASKENFKMLKENSMALNILSNFSEEEIQNLYKNMDNIENKNIADIVKNIFINKEGKNLLNFLGDLKNMNLKEKDILFLFKNDFKLNIENLKVLDDFLSNKENMGTLLDKLNSLGKELSNEISPENIKSNIKENLETIKANGENFINTKEDKVDFKKNTDIIDNKIVDKDEILNDNNLNVKKDIKDIKDIIKSMIKNLDSDKEVNIEKFQKDLESLLKSVGIEKDINLGKIEKHDINNINQKLEFLNKMSNDYMYFQVPFCYKEYKNLAEIILDKKDKKGEKNNKSISIFMSLNTYNLDKVDTMLNYNKDELRIVFGAQNENVLKIFKSNEAQLTKSLKNIGIKDVYINYRLKEENESILSNLEYINNKFSNFNVWV